MSATAIEETAVSDLAVRSEGGDYRFLDSGKGRRLEQYGPFRLVRPCPAALWPPEEPDSWAAADAVHERGRGGEGRWNFRRPLPSRWMIEWQGLRFEIKPTGFGHTGLFPEHAVHWPWLARNTAVAAGGPPPRVLNLFAYTGALTLAAARAGAEVCHVDAVPDVVAWARRNAESSGLADKPIRWIQDDVMKFVAREIRRGRRYDLIVLDPPSYGKGPRGERWLIEEHLPALIGCLPDLISANPAGMLLTCHSTGFSAAAMRNLLDDFLKAVGGFLQAGAMLLGNTHSRRCLPSGCYARWTPSKSAKTGV